MIGDEPFLPKPPSKFHEDRGRGKSSWRHDKMQAELLAFLRARSIAGLPANAVINREVEAEYPLTKRGQVVSFVDAIEVLDVNLLRFVSAFEVKPEIDSPCAIVRQAKSSAELLRHQIKFIAHLDYHLVCDANDPKLADLRAEWPHVWAWGVVFDPDTGATR